MSASESPASSPLMAQYLAIKREHPDALLFYRMGDFYELFFEDAAKAAGALDIALTKRGQHDGQDIPMAGVPVHAADGYLARLIRQGFKVAVCEQVEDPAEARKRGAKAVVKRDVVRLVTPGTLTEDTLLEARANNYLAALAEAEGRLALAWCDISTGELAAAALPAGDLASELARLEPGELLIPDRLLERERVALTPWLDRLTLLPGARFDSLNGEARLKALFKVATLAAYGEFGRPELAALGALVDYIALTQKGRLPQLAPPGRRAAGSRLSIDQATRRNLELFATLSGERRGSLLAAIDRTVTGAGARLLAQRLAAPLTDRPAIERRLDAVAFLLTEAALRAALRQGLRAAPDAERALSRLTLGRGGPRDLLALARALKIAEALAGELTAMTGLPPALLAVAEGLGRHDTLVAKLAAALNDEPPLFARDGGFVRAGHAPELDELRQLRDESRRLIAGLQADYAKRVGVSGLRIKHNNVLGYFVELSAVQAERLPPEAAGKEGFLIHRQTLASAVRYTTAELGQLEQKILSAGDKALALELAIFEALAAAVAAEAPVIQRTARALAKLDVAAGLAELASDASYVRPEIREDGRFAVAGGRHPVVEQALAAEGQRFVANDCDLSEGQRLWLLTGPNMAGKSTFLRQNALIAILAQMGGFVPAERAEIGIVDRLFSRVGAADDLARGRSTFMVEMVETAAILNQAGPRSLVILDEIGRGTATFDGLSIAWATLEQLHEANRCRALFATHFHELTRLAKRLPNLALNTMRVREWKGEVVFLHQVAPGAADRSYGIHVARLAGLPAAVVARAEEVLAQLEAGQDAGALARLVDDLPLFQAAERRAGRKEPSALLTRLAEIRPDELSPRQALELIYELRRLAEEEGGLS